MAVPGGFGADGAPPLPGRGFGGLVLRRLVGRCRRACVQEVGQVHEMQGRIDVGLSPDLVGEPTPCVEKEDLSSGSPRETCGLRASTQSFEDGPIDGRLRPLAFAEHGLPVEVEAGDIEVEVGMSPLLPDRRPASWS